MNIQYLNNETDKEVELTLEYHCLRCHHNWRHRKAAVPNNCGKCKSALWNIFPREFVLTDTECNACLVIFCHRQKKAAKRKRTK